MGYKNILIDFSDMTRIDDYFNLNYDIDEYIENKKKKDNTFKPNYDNIYYEYNNSFIGKMSNNKNIKLFDESYIYNNNLAYIIVFCLILYFNFKSDYINLLNDI